MSATSPVTSLAASTEEQDITIAFGLITPPAPAITRKPRARQRQTLSSGLVIVPTFDSTITNDPRSSAIQAMIISAIQKYQTLFSDPITVSIRFRYSGYHLEGDPMGTLIGASNSGLYQLDWNTYIAALKADGKTANDMSANATLPTSALSHHNADEQCQWSGSWVEHTTGYVCRWQSRPGRAV